MRKNVERMVSEWSLIDEILATFPNIKGLFGEMLITVVGF
jgi:hypothetical protein